MTLAIHRCYRNVLKEGPDKHYSINSGPGVHQIVWLFEKWGNEAAAVVLNHQDKRFRISGLKAIYEYARRARYRITGKDYVVPGPIIINDPNHQAIWQNIIKFNIVICNLIA